MVGSSNDFCFLILCIIDNVFAIRVLFYKGVEPGWFESQIFKWVNLDRELCLTTSLCHNRYFTSQLMKPCTFLRMPYKYVSSKSTTCIGGRFLPKAHLGAWFLCDWCVQVFVWREIFL